MNLTKRKPAATEPDPALEARPAKPGGKNAPTPRRNAARAQRATTLKGAPVSKKDARKQTRAAYDANRELLKQTDVSKLPAHERVPELIYARDLVDTRVHLAAALFPVIGVYFVATFVLSHTKDKGLQTSLFFLSFFWLLGIVVDLLVMSRRVENRVRLRHPDSTVKIRGYAFRRGFGPKWLRRPVVRAVPSANHWKAR